MATIRGCRGKMKAGATPTLIGELVNWRWSETAAQIDASIMGACVKKFEVGAVESTVTSEFWYDPTDSGQGEFSVGTAVDIEIYPDGDTTGKAFKTANATVQQIDVDGGGVDALVRGTVNLFVNGALTDDAVP